MSEVSRYVLPSAVVPVHYKLEITPDLVGLDFTGSQDIDVVVNESVDCITLHAKELSVTAVTFTSAAAGSKPLAAVEIAYQVSFYQKKKEDIVMLFIF
jgi:hypothetical protein